MIKHYKILILFFLFQNLYSQKVTENTIDSLIVKSLMSRLDFVLSSGIKYIEPNEYGLRIKNKVRMPFVILEKDKLFETAYKSNKKNLTIYRIVPEIISKDTIDVNIGEISLTAKKGLFFRPHLHFKKMNYLIPCGGTNGYQPDFRFVFNSKNKKWENISEKYKIKTN